MYDHSSPIDWIDVIGGSGSGNTGGSSSGGLQTTGMIVGTNHSGDAQWNSAGLNTRLFRTGITNWGAESNPWDSTTLSDLSAGNYKVTRFMDWQSTNWSPLQT